MPDMRKKLSLFGWARSASRKRSREISGPEIRARGQRLDAQRRDYEQTLGRFARREIQVLLGTQMIAKGLDYPNVTLVGVISGDTALALPDFRAAERTFQLITQVAGRAGRGDAPGASCCKRSCRRSDDSRGHEAGFRGFAKTELRHRKEVGLPPYTRMVRIDLRDQDADKLTGSARDRAAAHQRGGRAREFGRDEGPMPCAISRCAGTSGTRSC
jgi:primosomal protein N' (replication factor Y)